MAKIKEKKKREGERAPIRFPLTRINFMILAFGVILLAVGYIFMAIPDDPDAFLTRTLSPIILVIGYLVVIPIGLFYRDKSNQ